MLNNLGQKGAQDEEAIGNLKSLMQNLGDTLKDKEHQNKT
jgi:uncharacterized membrane protein YoaK (UPF0700 family)